MRIPATSFYCCKQAKNLVFRMAALVWCVCLAGCNAAKHVPEGDALFWGYTTKLEYTEKPQDLKILKTEVDGAVLPKPNAKFLGLIPLKLHIHNLVGPTEKEKGFKHWLSYTVGQPPVLFSLVDTGSIQSVMSNKLHNRGYFQNSVSSSTTIKRKKAQVAFTAKISKPYKIRNVEFPKSDSLPIYKDLRDVQQYSRVKPGENYNLNVLLSERERITQRLLNRGYYKFGPDLLIFKVDSTIGNNQVDVYLRVKQDANLAQLEVYTIEDVHIFTNYSLTDTLPILDTVKYKEYNYIPNDNYIKAKHLLRSVFIERGMPFSQRNHTLTISRLMDMGSFQYANIRYEPDTTNPNKLDAGIYLTPSTKKSLRLEAQMVTKSNNFAGPGFTVSYRNRNALKGSELLTVNLITSYETQVGGGSGSEKGTNAGSALNSYEVGLNTELVFPRIIAPIRIRNSRSELGPQTRMAIGYSFLNRVEFFQLNSYQASYGYRWRPRRTLTWSVTPLNIHYVQLGSVQDTFKILMDERPYLRRSFEQQFIFGSIYQLTYSNQVRHWLKNHFYNNVSLDLSGNSINAIKSLLGADSPTDDEPRNLINQPAFAAKPFSQYIRFENDFRYYYNFTKTNQLATRLITGVGYAYGNSVTLPYLKQFSIGGTNSIRAFRARSIGPGTYAVPESETVSYFDQTGDVKLEANIEYRFPLTNIFRGALFLDAGNIWLLDSAADRPGGEFKADKFLQQLAIGTGFGLRVDVEFFVLRFDMGIPVRRPAVSANGRNALKDFKFGLGNDNGMVLNIAIGYPF